MLNFMSIVKIRKSTFDEWKYAMDDFEEMTQNFMRNQTIAKVDENTGIICGYVFDPELMNQFLSDPALQEMAELYGTEHVVYHLEPAPTP